MRYLLDTNVISEFIAKKPNQKVLDYIKSLDEDDIYLSVITIGEIKFGIQKVKNQSRKEQLLSWLEDDLLQRFEGKIIDYRYANYAEVGRDKSTSSKYRSSYIYHGFFDSGNFYG